MVPCFVFETPPSYQGFSVMGKSIVFSNYFDHKTKVKDALVSWKLLTSSYSSITLVDSASSVSSLRSLSSVSSVISVSSIGSVSSVSSTSSIQSAS